MTVSSRLLTTNNITLSIFCLVLYLFCLYIRLHVKSKHNDDNIDDDDDDEYDV